MEQTWGFHIWSPSMYVLIFLFVYVFVFLWETTTKMFTVPRLGCGVYGFDRGWAQSCWWRSECICFYAIERNWTATKIFVLPKFWFNFAHRFELRSFFSWRYSTILSSVNHLFWHLPLIACCVWVWASLEPMIITCINFICYDHVCGKLSLSALPTLLSVWIPNTVLS